MEAEHWIKISTIKSFLYAQEANRLETRRIMTICIYRPRSSNAENTEDGGVGNSHNFIAIRFYRGIAIAIASLNRKSPELATSNLTQCRQPSHDSTLNDCALARERR
jgi:hypothetical protein